MDHNSSFNIKDITESKDIIDVLIELKIASDLSIIDSTKPLKFSCCSKCNILTPSNYLLDDRQRWNR